MLNRYINNLISFLFYTVTIFFTTFYIFILLNTNSENFEYIYNLFTSYYFVVPLLGSFAGLIGSSFWGGTKSFLGKGLLFISIGLFLQALGQATNSYYINVLGVETPYPSLAEFALVGSLLSYILGTYNLSLVSQLKTSIQFRGIRISAIVIGFMAFFLAIYHYVVYHDSTVEPSITITMLEIMYPLLQGIYIAIAVLTLYILKNLMGGTFLQPFFLLLLGLILLYIADSVFLWVPYFTSDGFYLSSYILIGLGVVFFGKLGQSEHLKFSDKTNNGQQ